MASVELHNAYFYDCDSCGRENFHRGITVAFSKEDVESVRKEYGLEEDDLIDGTWSFKPAQVICEHCKAVFDVEED